MAGVNRLGRAGLDSGGVGALFVGAGKTANTCTKLTLLVCSCTMKCRSLRFFVDVRSMTNVTKVTFLNSLAERFGSVRKLDRSQSLYEIGGTVRLYIRYSALHSRNQAFYGLREQDLKQLEGYPSILCFLWESQTEPLLVPFIEYEDVFRSTVPAGDGQYKAIIYLGSDALELYIAQAGRFNIEGHTGWSSLEILLDAAKYKSTPDLSHSQVQTLIGAIGITKGYDIWIPQNDRNKLDWSFAPRFECRGSLPFGFERISNILQEVDVVWVRRGSSDLTALFEVEHSTPIYSGLLRFNDIHLVAPNLHPRFTIVSNDNRRALFVRQLNRPTFQASGLGNFCTFLEYVNVIEWYKRVSS